MDVIGTESGLSDGDKLRILKKRLAYLLQHPRYSYRLNAREVSDTGRAYTDEAIDAGEVMSALGRCTLRQQRIFGLWLGPAHSTQERIADRLGVSVITVKRDVAEALRLMVAHVWDE